MPWERKAGREPGWIHRGLLAVAPRTRHSSWACLQHRTALASHSQLNMARKKMFFLQEFSEGPLKFKPTYKFDLYSDQYDTR